MKKKSIFCLLLAAAMLFSVVACDDPIPGSDVNIVETLDKKVSELGTYAYECAMYGGTPVYKFSAYPNASFVFDDLTAEQKEASIKNDAHPLPADAVPTAVIFTEYALPNGLKSGMELSEFSKQLTVRDAVYADMDDCAVHVIYTYTNNNVDYYLNVTTDVTEQTHPQFFELNEKYDANAFNAYKANPDGKAAVLRLTKNDGGPNGAPEGEQTILALLGQPAKNFKKLKYTGCMDGGSWCYNPDDMGNGVEVVFYGMDDDVFDALREQDNQGIDPVMPGDETVKELILYSDMYALPGNLTTNMDVSEFVKVLGTPSEAMYWYNTDDVRLLFRLTSAGVKYNIMVVLDFSGDENMDMNAFRKNPQGKVRTIMATIFDDNLGGGSILDFFAYNYKRIDDAFGPLYLAEIIHGGTFLFASPELADLYFNFDADANLYDQYIEHGEGYEVKVPDTASVQVLYVDSDVYRLPFDLGVGSTIDDFRIFASDPKAFYEDMNGYMLAEFEVYNAGIGYSVVTVLDVTEENHPELFQNTEKFDEAKYNEYKEAPFGEVIEMRIGCLAVG